MAYILLSNNIVTGYKHTYIPKYSDFLVLISVGLAQAHPNYMHKICININVHVEKLIVINVLQLYNISFHNCSIVISVHTSKL